ncbi:MAG TPA: hypothetical protein VGG83_10830 [Trebonia sp.]|jgi:hypothetical protein
MAISAAAFAVENNNGNTTPPTPYTILSGDVSGGIRIPASFFTGTVAAPYGQPGFLPEKLRLFFVTSAAGTNFTVVVKASQPTTDVPNEAPFTPAANSGDFPLNINTAATYFVGPLTSGRFLQPDGSVLLNFTGTLGTTTVYGYVGSYYPAGPRG